MYKLLVEGAPTSTALQHLGKILGRKANHVTLHGNKGEVREQLDADFIRITTRQTKEGPSDISTWS
jgi:hypothetical protein